MANEYLEYSKAKHSEKTWKEKRDIFKRFFRTIDANLAFTRITADLLRIYFQEQAVQRSGHASNKDRKNLTAWANWVQRYKGFPIGAFAFIERFPEQRAGRYIPPTEDFWKVFETTEGQDKTMLLAYLHLAARRNELFRLTWDDVDFGSRTVRLATRKRKEGSWEYDYLPMTEDLFKTLLAHRNFVSGQWVFPARSGKRYQYRIHVMRKLCKKAGVRRFGFHAIRHLSGSILAESGVPMIQIQKVLRHKNLRTTERYLHSLGDIRESMERSFQRGIK